MRKQMKQMEINKIYNEDCLEGMKRIADGSVGMIVADPPYTMTKRGKSCRPNWMPNYMSIVTGKQIGRAHV